MRFLHATLPCLLLLTVSACAQTQQLELGMSASQEAVVLVTGDQPFVTIENDGPGALEVQFYGEDSRDRIPARTATGSTLVSPATIRLRTEANGATAVRIIAERASGIEVQSQPIAADD